MTTLLTSLLANLDNVSSKTAADSAQPPQEGHPTDHIDDHVAVPTGDTITTAADDQVDRLGNLAAGSSSPATNDKEKIIPTMQTKVLDGTSSPSELTPGEGLDDPGPDSSHPASPNKNEKYASMRTAKEILAEMNKVADFTRGQLSTANVQAKKASEPSKPTSPAAVPQAPAGTDKFAAALNELIAPDKREAAIKSAAHTLEPLVSFGVGMAIKVANFMAAAEQDPAAAAAMMDGGDMGGGDMGGGAPPMDPAAGGAPPMDPAAGGAGGDPIQALIQQIEAVAQQLQVDPSELMMALAGQGGGGGAPPAAGGGAPPPMGGGEGGEPSASPSDSAPKDSSSSEGGSPAKSEEKGESDEPKEAGAPSKKAQARTQALRKQVNELLDELDC